MKRPDHAEVQKYRQLLIVLITVFLVSPFLKTGIGSILADALLLYAIILVIRSLALPKVLFSVYLAIACVAFGFQVSLGLGWISPFEETMTLNRTIVLIPQSIFALYLGGATYWIGQDVFTTPDVTADKVRGGISVYLLIGYLWALFYGIVATFDADAFSQPLFLEGSFLRALHFSFTTLTTLGYGDIVPLSEVAQVLTNLEAIVGQIYSTVFIAILVGGYLTRRS